jgi:L-fucose mutarotase
VTWAGLFPFLSVASEPAMLKRIPAILSPELLYLIAQMGHGDELVIADANFPATTMGKRVVRADGHSVPAILEAVLQLFPLDSFVEAPAAVMQRVDSPGEPAPVWTEFQRLLDSAEAKHVSIERVERFAFYERAQKAFGVVATGETALYGNLILKKGVIAPA